MNTPFSIANRFRGFLPVVVDVETGGFNSRTDALLENDAVNDSVAPEFYEVFDKMLKARGTLAAEKQAG